MSGKDGWIVARNNLRKERLEAGITEPRDLAARAEIDPDLYEHLEAGRLLPTPEQFKRIRAALGDISEFRLYGSDMLQIMGVANYVSSLSTAREVMEWVKGPMKLYVARDEVTWQESRVIPDEPVEAFLSLACGTQASPHLLLDAVAVAKALGIRFVAAAGPAGCCGKPYLGKGQFDAGEAFSLNKIEYAQRIGASTTVTWCHACMQTVTNAAARREILGGVQHPVSEQWIGNFLAERVAALGDGVPWKRKLSRRVLLDLHPTADAHRSAGEAMAALLSLIPGVEVIGELDGELKEIRPCATRGRDNSGGLSALPRWTPAEKDRRSADAAAARLAELVSARGADTVSSTHFGCHNRWSRYASDRMAVRHAVSILAEALGCAHPDRAQAAAHVGDPIEVVKQTRAIWETWNLTEDEALELAANSSYPKNAGPIGCSCETHSSDDLITVDIVNGVSPGLNAVR